MNCAVCLEDNVLEKNVHYMECLHFLCDFCFIKLLNNRCPLCREEITLLQNKSYSYNTLEDDDNDDGNDNHFLLYEILHNKKDRHENKRKKYQKKKDKLNNLLSDNKNNFDNIPNNKKRINNKIKLHNIVL